MTIPFACIGIAFVLIYLPKAISSAAMMKMPGGYDNEDPRQQQAKLTGWGARAQAAHLNAFESFAPFAAAVLVATLARANAAWMDRLAIAHVAARFVYPFLYVAGYGWARSAVWGVGLVATIGLFALPMIGG